MRVRIDGVGFAVGCPTCVRDTDRAIRIFVCAEGFQFRHFAFRFIYIQLSLSVDKRHSGTIVAAVLQPVQSFYQYRVRLAFADVTNYSTHKAIYDLTIYELISEP